MAAGEREIRLPLSQVSVTLTREFEAARVSSFLDKVLSDDFDLAGAQQRPQAILEDFGIRLTKEDRDRLGQMSFEELLGRKSEGQMLVPAVAVAVAIVIVLWPSDAE